jgi:hypothetical protein
MKKILVLGLLLVYGATSFGISLNLHYCCGQLQEITLLNADDHNCGEKQSKSFASISKNCCIDQQLSFSLHTDQSQSRQEIIIAQVSEALAASAFQLPTVAQLPQGNHFPLSCNSPPGSSISLFIQHCVFRI